MSDTPETIYLIPDYDEGVLGHVWCDDPAPGLGMKPEDAIEYRRADVVEATLAKQAKAAKNGMDAARKASSQELKTAQRLRDESKPELVDSEREANAILTARIAELERVNAVMDEELRTKTQALFDLEKDNEHLLASCAQLQKTGGHRQQRLEVALRDCLHALTLASRSLAPAAQRAAALLKDN